MHSFKKITLLSFVIFTATTFSMEKDCNPVETYSDKKSLDKNEMLYNDNNNMKPAQQETQKPTKHLERFFKHYYLLELSHVREASIRE